MADEVKLSTKHVNPTTGQPFKLGLIPTPPEKLARVSRFRSAHTRATLPKAVAFLPKLQMWGNDQFGDCVSAQEAFAKACCGIQIPDAQLISWAKQHGFANGANLTDVMDSLKSSPFVLNGHRYGDGDYQAVDFNDANAICSAIATSKAPLNIAIDHSALSSQAGSRMGWSGINVQGRYRDYDHCVGVSGYGPASFMFPLYGAQVPAGISPDMIVFGIFTWSTIGLVDISFFRAACSEMYVRNPTTTTDGAPGPDPIVVPGPDPVPVPVPPAPTPTPTPTPSPSQNGLPWWAYLAIGGGAALVGAIGLLIGKFVL